MALNLFSSDTDSNKIYKHDGVSASILDSFSSPYTQPRGITHEYIGC